MNGRINKALAILGGVGAGAAAMYFLDPDRGRRRRALVRDKMVGLSHDAQKAVVGHARHLRNRTIGLAHDAKELVGIRNTPSLETATENGKAADAAHMNA